MHTRLRILAAAISIAASTLLAAQPLPPVRNTPYPGVMTLDVDATDLAHKIFNVKQSLPVKPGPLVLYYPRWLPGNHSPTGTVSKLAGLRMSAAGKPLAWQRNTLDSHAFHVNVPAGAGTMEIEFQFISALERGSGRVVVTPEILGLQWNNVLLYPAGYAASSINVKPRLTLPEGWGFGSALTPSERRGAKVEFQTVSVDTLVDSPVFAGQHFQQVDLDPGARDAGRAPVFLNVVADQAKQGVPNTEQLAAHRALVTQSDRVFGPRRFARYDFLLAVSDQFSGIGLEHHQSSENGVKSGYFTDWSKGSIGRDLLAHEYAHSWNGKFRRPADLWTPHFNTPMQNSLLWVYEGQTQYWGAVLAARSGLVSAADSRENLANTAAWLDARAGRVWRSLQDTTNEPIISTQGWQRDWRDWQRGGDYYDESRLIWLEADMLIREHSKGQRSLDDFARSFFGVEPQRAGRDTRPVLYGFDDVVRELNRVQPHDWAGFLRQRLDTREPAAPLAGITQSGWKLGWSEQPSDYVKAIEAYEEAADFTYSLGLVVGKEGKLARVVWGSPAFQAGLTSGATLLAVNGRSYKAERLKDAITAAKADGKIELLVKADDLYRSVPVSWRGGLRYPKLERIEGTPDRLEALFKPLP
jgi:predicted metalloprotease with PDZ domain